MTEPTSDMTGDAPVGGPPPPSEPGWQRLIVPGLALLAVVAALVAFGVWGLLSGQGTTQYAGQRIELAPGATAETPFKGFAIKPERPAPDLELTDQSGQPWKLADQRGQAVALFFGYTHCPDVCPQTMQRLAEAVDQLGPDAQRLKVALITVDPERDTASAMGEYVKSYNPAFTGLTGTPEQIQAVAKDYGIQYAKELPPAQATEAARLAGQEASESAGDGTATGGADAHGAASVITPGTQAYTVAHSGVVFLIDPSGQMRSSFLGPFDPAEVVHDVRYLLAGN
jgi:cytochrome oxidase Cu insertion factor (SCO1/SenC/PrrC family)